MISQSIFNKLVANRVEKLLELHESLDVGEWVVYEAETGCGIEIEDIREKEMDQDPDISIPLNDFSFKQINEAAKTVIEAIEFYEKEHPLRSQLYSFLNDRQDADDVEEYYEDEEYDDEDYEDDYEDEY